MMHLQSCLTLIYYLVKVKNADSFSHDLLEDLSST